MTVQPYLAPKRKPLSHEENDHKLISPLPSARCPFRPNPLGVWKTNEFQTPVTAALDSWNHSLSTDPLWGISKRPLAAVQ